MFYYEIHSKSRLWISKCKTIVKQIGSNNEIILKFKQPNGNYKTINIDPDEVRAFKKLAAVTFECTDQDIEALIENGTYRELV